MTYIAAYMTSIALGLWCVHSPDKFRTVKSVFRPAPILDITAKAMKNSEYRLNYAIGLYNLTIATISARMSGRECVPTSWS